MGRDATSLQAENDALRRELELLHDALERMPHGMCAFDSDDHLVLANAHYRKIWCLPEAVTRRGSTFRQVMEATPGRETTASRSQPQPAPGTEGTRWREWQLDDGRIVEIVVSRRADGSCVALHEDVTELRQSQERIAFLARHDLLTGLPNRGVLREELERSLIANRRGDTLALLCLDLDRFKPVNDNFGHAAGDELLRQVAARLRECVRETDVVARLGGDEFAVMRAWKDAGFRIGGHIVFRKRYASRARFVSYTHESAYVLAKGRPVLPENPPADVIDFPYSGNRLHPTQKPVAALTPLIEAFCPEGGLVLDPFCGSGSTLVAACDVNCDYLGIELDQAYHRIAARRLAA